MNLDEILWGILEFSQQFVGILVTESMIIEGVNDMTEELEMIVDFISDVNPGKSYLSIPARTPAEKRVRPASEHTLSIAYHTLNARNIDVEYLSGYEGNAFASTGNVEEDLLSSTSVHPTRENAVKEYLTKSPKR